MGNFINACVILISMVTFGQTGSALDPVASRNIIILQVGLGLGLGTRGHLSSLFSLIT